MLLMMPCGKQTNLHKTIRDETEQTTETCINSTATVAAAAANDPRQQQQMKTSSTSTADSGSSGSRSTEKRAATTSVDDKDQLKTRTKKKKKKKHRHDDAADGLKGVAAAKEEEEELDDEEVAVGAASASGDKTSEQQQQQPPRMTSVDDSTILPEWYSPSEDDVICSWARQNHGHRGNERFRTLVDRYAPVYAKASTKYQKSEVIAVIVSEVRQNSKHGGFVKKDFYSGRWFEIGDEKARDKVGHAIRKAAAELQKKKGKSGGDGDNRGSSSGGSKLSSSKSGKSSKGKHRPKKIKELDEPAVASLAGGRQQHQLPPGVADILSSPLLDIMKGGSQAGIGGGTVSNLLSNGLGRLTDLAAAAGGGLPGASSAFGRPTGAGGQGLSYSTTGANNSNAATSISTLGALSLLSQNQLGNIAMFGTAGGSPSSGFYGTSFGAQGLGGIIGPQGNLNLQSLFGASNSNFLQDTLLANNFRQQQQRLALLQQQQAQLGAAGVVSNLANANQAIELPPNAISSSSLDGGSRVGLDTSSGFGAAGSGGNNAVPSNLQQLAEIRALLASAGTAFPGSAGNIGSGSLFAQQVGALASVDETSKSKDTSASESTKTVPKTS